MGGGPLKETLLCALPFPEPTGVIANLRERFPDIDIIYQPVTYSRDLSKTLNEIPKELWARTAVLFTLFTVPSPADAPNMQLVHLASAGSNQIHDKPVYKNTDVVITTSSGIHGPQIAEWVVMTSLVVSHKYHRLYELQKQHQWGSKGPSSEFATVRDWVGRRVGILGYGSIGRQVGRVMKAMGAEIVAYTATPKDTPEKRRDHGFIVPGTGDAQGEAPSEWYSGLEKENLHRFLQQDLDWLLVSVPLTEQTRHLLSTEEFKVLSNNGSKPVFTALSGAALDVTDPEPLPSDSELWDLPNVVITPHVSGNGVAYVERTFKVLEVNLERRQKGEKLLNVVQRSRGY